MMRLLLSILIVITGMICHAATIKVKNISELDAANKTAQPGDIIILQNGSWNDVTIRLDCSGVEGKPIVFKAETPGKVIISGHSQLKIGGSFIVVDGLYFTRGYAGDDAVINFRINNEKLAVNCRVTNTVIDDFNNPKRMDENNWVLFYGKNNQLDHCSFRDKKNMGVLLAVILDDDRSRENFHSIDHNYFGRRPPLGSNGGEIIRVGVSQHCQFNSNTKINNNFFEHCNGETEIISIKSCNNIISGNIFKECEGSLVLRHGNDNLVTANIFLGNNKPNTGGVRVINKGQKIRENIFYKCRGTGFRSPMAIMNGIPNSPAHRYVQVTDAEITGNSFYECSPLSFGEGSDAERSLPPENVIFKDNTFYNTIDSIIFRTWDKITGIHFENNKVSRQVAQDLPVGFTKLSLSNQKAVAGNVDPEHPKLNQIAMLEQKSYASQGAKWFLKKQAPVIISAVTVDCKNADEIYRQLEKNKPVTIRLTGTEYIFYKPVFINQPTRIRTNRPGFINWHTVPALQSLFVISGKGSLALEKLKLDGADVKSTHLISNDSSGSTEHFHFSMNGCSLTDFSNNNGCENLFFIFKSSIADSISIRNSYFENNAFNILVMNDEKDDKGYYNAEKIALEKNTFINNKGMILDIYRGGNDESTLGPDLLVSDNTFDNCNTEADTALIRLFGVQKTRLFFNSFMDCNSGKTLLLYKDIVRAQHILQRNLFNRSGSVVPNNYVIDEKNLIQ